MRVLGRLGVVLLVAPLPISYGLTAQYRALWTAAVLVTLCALFIAGRARLERRWELWCVATFLVIVSTFSASAGTLNMQGHLTAAAYLILLWGIAPPVFASLVRSPGFVITATTTFVIVQTGSSVVALRQAISGGAVLGREITHGRTPGLAGHTNILGLLAGVAAIACLVAVLENRHKLASLVLGGVNFAAVLTSGSLTAMFATLAAILCTLAVMRVRPRVVAGVGVALTIAFVASLEAASRLTTFQSPIERVLQTTGQTDAIGTLDQRVQSIRFGWARIQEDWVYGVGLDNASGVTFDQITLVHCLPVRAWFQGGLALLIAVLVVYTILVRAALGAWRAHVGAAEVGTLVTAVAFSLTSASFQQPYFWLTVVLAWASLEHKVSDQQDKHGPPVQVPRTSQRLTALTSDQR